MVFAGLAGITAVLAIWDILATIERVRVPKTVKAAIEVIIQSGTHGRIATPPERRRLALLGAMTLFLAGWLLAGIWVGVIIGVAGPWSVLALLRWRQRHYLAEVSEAAPMVARALADALGAGYSIRGAIGQAAGGVTGPAAIELHKASLALEFGEQTEVILNNLRRKVNSSAFDTIIAALLLQRDAGGDLARLLRNIAGALEDSVRLERDARAATAQARFTAIVVATLPVGAALLAQLANSSYLTSLWHDPTSRALIIGSLLLQATAWIAIKRLTTVRA